MNVLAIGAHFDDVELGCGGALAKHSKNGDQVYVFVATNSQFSNNQGDVLRKKEVAFEEAKQAQNIIGYHMFVGNISTFYLEYGEEVHAKLLQIIEKNQIDLIYTHWTGDVHHDHRNLSLATLHTARHVNRILMYQSNWYVSEQEFCKNFYIDITDTWEKKEKAIRAYQTEMQRTGETWIEYFKQEAKGNGLKVGVEYAEAFQMVKWLW